MPEIMCRNHNDDEDNNIDINRLGGDASYVPSLRRVRENEGRRMAAEEKKLF